jgi:hypothetical protein
MRKLTTSLFLFVFTVSLAFAQDGSRTQMVDTHSPITIEQGVTSLFMDDMNGDNTLAGIQGRGWVFVNADAGGTTDVFQGNSTVFSAYEGPADGYIGQNFNGANGLLMDQWLISPEVTVAAGDTLKFWQRSPDGSTYPDPLQIWVSTTGGTTPAAFDVQLDAFNGSTAGWQQFVGNFPTAGTVRFAIRYYSTNGGVSGSQTDYVGLDYFEVVAGAAPSNNIFFENFDSYTAGSNLVTQNPTFWTTWDGGAGQDPLVSNAFSYSSPNSVVIVQNNDLVKDFGVAYTSGKYKIKFYAYIAATKAGYFNTLATFAGTNSDWGLEVYFDAGGTGRVNGGSATSVPFSWPVATWFPVENVVDLDANLATITINGVLVHTWQWTLGATGSGAPLTLDANDFFGATANDQMYVDDYSLEDLNVVPVELSAFAANVNNNTVTLNWTTETELNNQGFEVQRRLAEGQFITIGHVQGFGTTTERKQYSFTDAGLETGNYYYRLKQVDFNGVYEYSNEIFVEVNPPLVFGLDQNYPNPFNPTTSINFSLAEPSFVKLAVYNLLGEEVALLKNEFMTAGSFNVTFDAASLPSGMYLYKLETAQFSSVRKMMLMK